MADLVVTSAALEESKAKLTAVKEEFDNSGDRVRDNADVWGQRDVANAMHEFVENWKIHRGKISSAVGDLEKKLQDAIDAWNDTEEHLASSLTTETKSQ